MSRETNLKRPIRFTGSGRVKRIVQIGLGALKAPGVKPATYGDYGLNGSYSFAKDDENNVGCIIALPREMDHSVAPAIGFGWASPATTGNVRWRIQYLYLKPDQDTSSSTPDDTVYSTEAVSTTANGYKFKYLDFAAPDEDDRILALKVSRLGADDLDTADNVANLLMMAFEYTLNKLGS